VETMAGNWLDRVKWDEQGLVPTIAQEVATNAVLTLAWMNRESLAKTVATGEAHYWSRSRRRLWKKGEQSGNVQRVREIRLDCDEDVLLLKVEQQGGIACHTGRHSCFFQKLEDGRWVTVEPVIKDPKEIYGR
jgi:phosphoribosyl-AMP cyclohydrolase